MKTRTKNKKSRAPSKQDGRTTAELILIFFGWQRKKWATRNELAAWIERSPASVPSAFTALRRAGYKVLLAWDWELKVYRYFVRSRLPA